VQTVALPPETCDRLEQIVGFGYDAVPLNGDGVAYVIPAQRNSGKIPNPRATELVARHGTRLHPPTTLAGRAVIAAVSPGFARIRAEAEELPDPGTELVAHIRSHALRHGWALSAGDVNGQPVTSTVGLTVFGHPELVVVGMAPAAAHAFLNNLASGLVLAHRYTGPTPPVPPVVYGDIAPVAFNGGWWEPVRVYHQLWPPTPASNEAPAVQVWPADQEPSLKLSTVRR